MKIRPLFCVLTVLLMLCISRGMAANEPMTLPTGNQIEILGMGQVNFPKEPSALMLKYQTSLNLDDKSALRREVDLVWQRFIHDVEKANLTSAVISANEVPKGGIISQNRSYNYVLKKVDGRWAILGPSQKETRPTKLDEGMINDFIARWDYTAADINVEGALLYMAPQWTGHMTEPGPDGKPKISPLDLKEFEQAGRSLQASIRAYKYARSDTRIEMAPDGQSATVISKITENMDLKNGKTIVAVSETADVIQLMDGQPLVKSSELKLISAQ